MRILIVKLTSMGDVVQTLPAIQDAFERFPELKIDWVVEKAFEEIPRWHPGVDQVISVSLRALKKDKRSFFRLTRDMSGQFKGKKYDAIIDFQGLLKSSILACFPDGTRHGVHFKNCREPLAALFYHKRWPINKNLHAIERYRRLMAYVLGYHDSWFADQLGDLQNIRYGISSNFPKTKTLKPMVMFAHSTTWATKHWPEMCWIELGQRLNADGFRIVLPWYTDIERKRANHLGSCIQHSIVLPKQSLTDLTKVMSECSGVVAVDTGLAHIAAAIDVPSVTLYGPTSPQKVGALGLNQRCLKVDFTCSPCQSRLCQFNVNPAACWTSLTPDMVYEQFIPLLKKAGF